MSNNLNQSEKNLQNLLEDYQPDYSSEAWDRLNKSLPVKSYKWYYIAASLLIGTMAAYFILNTDVNQSQVAFSENIPPLTESEVTIKNGNIENIVPVFTKENQPTLRKKSIDENRTKEIVLTKDDKSVVSKPKQDVIVEKLEENKEIESAEIIEEQEINEEITPVPVIILSAREGCEPLNIEFNIADLPDNSKVTWDLGNGIISQKTNFKHEYLKSGNYTVKLNVSTSTDNYSVEEEILVKASPKAEFEFIIENGLIVLENLSQDFETIEWEFSGIKSNDDLPNFEMLYSGTYPMKVKVVNEMNCSDVYMSDIEYKVDHKIFAPNAFTPDGDGNNDEFLIKYEVRTGYSYNLQIFNTVGVLLFESEDPAMGWNGDSKGKIQNNHQENYIWVLNIVDPRGVAVNYKGTFQKLMR